MTLLRLLWLDDNRLRYLHAGREKQLSQTGGEATSRVTRVGLQSSPRKRAGFTLAILSISASLKPLLRSTLKKVTCRQDAILPACPRSLERIACSGPMARMVAAYAFGSTLSGGTRA